MLIDDSHVVNLNVGGKVYTTTVATLNTFPNSQLAKMVAAGTGAARVDDKGNYFIDRDSELFRHILNFLREAEDFSLILTGDLQMEARYYGLLGSMFPYRPHLVEATVSSINRENLLGQQQGPTTQCIQLVSATVVISRDDSEQHNVTIVTHPQKLPVADRRLLLRVHAEQLNNGCGTGYKVFHDQCGACFEDHSCSF
eukprot:gene9113-10760_t